VTRESSTNIWLLFDMLARRRALVIGIVVVAVIGAIVVSLLLPSWYTAEVLLLPPKDMSVPMGGLSQLSDLASMTEGLELPMMVTPSHVYARILRSRTISESIIDSFNLRKRYETETRHDTYLALMSHTGFEVTDEGLLRIAVEDRDPQMAADMANAYVEELKVLNKNVVAQRAKQNREFIEQRLTQVRTELAGARSDLQQFQRENRAIDFDEQTRLAIDQAADLKIQLAKLDLEIEMGKGVLGPDNPLQLERKRRRNVIKEQLRKLEEGAADTSYFSMPVSEIPKLKGRYEDLYSRVRVNEQLYEMLLEQYEQARIAEQEQTPNISVLDSARVPEVRSRPQRTRIVAGAAVIALILSILIAALVDYIARMKSARPDDYHRFSRFVEAFFGWMPGVKSKPDSK
jgi:uncharacterized protein involved in exopolysaccharide biosynthesis